MATKHFNTVQEAVRKDIKRAFGGLKSKWHILTSPIWLWYEDNIKLIVKCCIVLHNMMVEEGVSDFVRDPVPKQDTSSFSILPPTLSNDFTLRQEIANNISSERVHRELTTALIHYQWAMQGTSKIDSR
jgi:hypothetical protein